MNFFSHFLVLNGDGCGLLQSLAHLDVDLLLQTVVVVLQVFDSQIFFLNVEELLLNLTLLVLKLFIHFLSAALTRILQVGRVLLRWLVCSLLLLHLGLHVYLRVFIDLVDSVLSHLQLLLRDANHFVLALCQLDHHISLLQCLFGLRSSFNWQLFSHL